MIIFCEKCDSIDIPQFDRRLRNHTKFLGKLQRLREKKNYNQIFNFKNSKILDQNVKK